jgi:uncharacterized protein
MSKLKEQAVLPGAEEVADYLARNPDFFENRDSLLQSMTVQQEDGRTVSLVERQVNVLRERSMGTRKKLDELVDAAERNNLIFDKCQALVLNLVASKDEAGFFNALEHSLEHDFSCAGYHLIVFGAEPRQVNHFTSVVTEQSAAEFIGALMNASKPTLGILRPTEQDFLFRHASDKVRSAAILPVKTDRLYAMLAIGSGDADYFKPSMGTLFIGFVAGILALQLPRYLEQ